MITVKDVKISHKTRNSTILQSWETYWFKVNNQETIGIEKQDGVFKFFAKHCKSLDTARGYIANFLNDGNKLQNI